MLVNIALAVGYWTFAVACVSILAPETSRDWKSLSATIGIAAAWPLFAVAMLFYLPYQATVASTSRIRIDLDNRKLLREFEGWLRERNAGKVSPKDE